jgi:large subunit ribosomal protein L24
MMARVKKNDQVVVVTGKYSGKRGAVIGILPAEDKVMVHGVGLCVKHVKRKQGVAGGIRREESYMALSNVMPWCSSCNKPCRVKAKLVDGEKFRACHRCQTTF